MKAYELQPDIDSATDLMEKIHRVNYPAIRGILLRDFDVLVCPGTGSVANDNLRRQLNHTPDLPSYHDTSKMYSATYRVSARVFSAVWETVKAVQSAFSHESRRVDFAYYPSTNHFIILTLRSLDSPAYSSVKRFLDRVFKGEILKSPIGQAVWNPFLGNTAAAPQLMSPLEQKYGGVFQCIPSKKTVRMYGSPEKVKDAQKAWKDVGMPLNHPSVKSIELDDQSLTWILTGGFEAISDAIGSESVMFNTLSTPKTVEILGPPRLCKTAETMLSQRKRVPQSTKDRAGRCSICLRKAEDPISANSGHFYCLACFESYCLACFESYCLSNFGHTNGGILTCPAEGGSCGALFQLEQLQQLLSSFTFERILISSFHTFRWHHGEELTYCSSNHCRQLRREVQSDLSKFPCQVCDKNASPYVVSSDEIDLEHVPNVPHRVDNLGRNSRLNAKTVPSCKGLAPRLVQRRGAVD